MGIYLGYIERIMQTDSIFYNFYPICQVNGEYIFKLENQEIRELLPESAFKNIHLAYHYNYQEFTLENYFDDNQPMLFEFELQDLEDNYRKGTNERERYPTGYRVLAAPMWENKKIRTPDKIGLFQVFKKDELVSNLLSDLVMDMSGLSLKAGTRILVQYDNGFYAGPLEVVCINQQPCILPKIKDKKYTLAGYQTSRCKEYTMSKPDGSLWFFARPDAPEQQDCIDVITDEQLLEGFQTCIPNEAFMDGKVDLTNMNAIIESYQSSLLVGLPENIQQGRLQKLRAMFFDEQKLDDTFQLDVENLCSLLVKYQDKENVNRLLQSMIEKYPAFIDKIQNAPSIKEKINQLQQEAEKLNTETEDLKQQLSALENNKKEKEKVMEKSVLKNKLGELENLEKKCKEKEEELQAIAEKWELFDNIASLEERKQELIKNVDYYEFHQKKLNQNIETSKAQLRNIIDEAENKMVNIAFDGFVSNKMLQAASQWASDELEKEYEEAVKAIQSIEVTHKDSDQLVEYLCKMVQSVRPQYSKNTILNIAICMTQGFLTVFSGEPGSGKTSICNIFAKVLGLHQIPAATSSIKNIDLSRYISVSVERGWTSKRDFIGYYNPLSKTFDKNNRRVYDGLKILDIEKQNHCSTLPFFILLDEANLSPMEYYWADFMNVCDELNENSYINLGEQYSFKIPETLRFVATINNDHTTETLSPRLIDRSWIITLPQAQHDIPRESEERLDKENIDIISWESLKNTFLKDFAMPENMPYIQAVYHNKIIPALKNLRIPISPRTDKAIKKYWCVAREIFEEDSAYPDTSAIALDYAVAQKILPKIAGNGESYGQALQELYTIFENSHLKISKGILKDILERGNAQLQYYQFFG